MKYLIWAPTGCFFVMFLYFTWQLHAPKWKRIWKSPDYQIRQVARDEWVIQREILWGLWFTLKMTGTAHPLSFPTEDDAWRAMQECGLNERARNVAIIPL